MDQIIITRFDRSFIGLNPITPGERKTVFGTSDWNLGSFCMELLVVEEVECNGVCGATFGLDKFLGLCCCLEIFLLLKVGWQE